MLFASKQQREDYLRLSTLLTGRICTSVSMLLRGNSFGKCERVWLYFLYETHNKYIFKFAVYLHIQVCCLFLILLSIPMYL